MIGDGGVLQGADDLIAAVERFEREPDEFTIGTRVAEWTGAGRHGVVENRRDEYHDLWPVGVLFDDGKYEACAASELRVERSAVIA